MRSLSAEIAGWQAASSDTGIGRPPSPDECHPGQWAVVNSEARLNAVMCGRQWGKTYAARALARLVIARPGTRVIYATLIRRNCKKLFWRPLFADLDAAGWTYTKNDTDMVATFNNGSWIQALSCSEMNDLRTIRGDQADVFIVDECQEPNEEVMRTLVLTVALAMLVKRRGKLYLFGTVPPEMATFFTDCMDDPGWQAFGHGLNEDGTDRTPPISMLDNPNIKPEDIRDTYAIAGIGEEHPIWQREVEGRRVRDPETIVYEYDAERNHVDLEDVDRSDRSTWRYSMGVDLGFQDADAIVVLGWNRADGDRRLYLVHEWHENHLDVEALSTRVRDAYAAYRPVVVTGDHGGHAAQKILKTLSDRLGVMIQPKPSDVAVSIGLVNDDLRTGRLKADKASDTVRDMAQVSWAISPKTGKREANKRGFHSDLVDALRYAHWGARHWRSKEPPKELTRNEKRDKAHWDGVKREQRIKRRMG